MTDINITHAVADALRRILVRSSAPAALYHYTTATGLLGVLGNAENALWASSVGFSNDTSEGRYATKVGEEVIDQHPLSEDKTEGWKEVLSFARSLFSSPQRDWEDAYVVSFCEEDNVLSQWRAYGGVASFSIGFRALSGASLTCAAGRDIFMVRVEYDAAKQRGLLSDILATAHGFLRAAAFVTEPIEKRVQFAVGILYVSVMQWACSVKHEAFKEEKEWRLTALPSRELLSASAIYGDLPHLTHYPDLREHRGRLLPYVRIKPSTGKFDIQSITIGPSKTQSSDAKAVELLRGKLGLADVKVVLSDIPLQP